MFIFLSHFFLIKESSDTLNYDDDVSSDALQQIHESHLKRRQSHLTHDKRILKESCYIAV